MATIDPNQQHLPSPLRIPRILSLDGGGVRGLSSLVILREIMNDIELQVGAIDLKPCEYFDLIGGTSTGGLIAIMLGTLGMTVDECIDAYLKLSKEVFQVDQVLAGHIPMGDDRCRFDYNILESVIKNMIEEKLGDSSCAMNAIPNTAKHCPTFIVAKTAANIDGPPAIFRTYRGAQAQPSKCALWQAARATSAAPTFFKSIFIEPPRPAVEYVDGGMGHNNPSELALIEARRIWPNCTQFGLVSIGTGQPKANALQLNEATEADPGAQQSTFEDISSYLPNIVGRTWDKAKNTADGVKSLIEIVRALTKHATTSEHIHQNMQRASQKEKQFPYFRFNVPRDVGDIGLGDWEKSSDMAAHTENYMRDSEIEERRDRCVRFLLSASIAHIKILDGLSLQDPTATDILNWLYSGNISSRLEKIRKLRAPNTGDWFLREFKNWIEGTSKLLLCPGIPGAGKSFLTSLVIDYLIDPTVNVKSLYIFFDYQNIHDQTADKVIASLLKQLIYSIDAIPPQVVMMYNEAKKESPRPTLSAFIDVFITYAKLASFIILFDAFDECDQQGIIISQLIRRMYNSGVKVFITHRPHVLQKSKDEFKESTVLEIYAHNEDVETYIAQQLNLEEKAKRLDERFKDVVIKEIRDHARGMFLLASFQLEHVLRETGQLHMETALKTLPTDPNIAYTQAMTRIKAAGGYSSATAIQTLTWIFHAARPLLIDELHEVLSLEVESDSSDHNRKLTVTDLIEICQSLIVYEDSSRVIRFVHPTVQEYLKSVDLLPVVTLAMTCLSYLWNDAFDSLCCDDESMETRMQTYKFCLYAAKFWVFHTRGEAETHPSIQQAVVRLLKSKHKRDSIIQMQTYVDESWDRLSFTEGQTILHILAKNGLATICRQFLDGELQYKS